MDRSAAREPATGPADLVITRARVRCSPTLDGAPSGWATGLAVRGDRIMALGDAATMAEWVGPRTRVVDAPDRLVVPGFQDAHVHAPFAGRNRLRVWLNDLEGKAAYLDAVAAYAGAHPDQEWIIGGGWAMEYFPGGTPRREDLDAVVPDRPVFLFNRDVHGAWVNSRALELGGIGRDTPDPADGRIERDPVTGEPTGTLHEGAAYAFNDTVVPTPTATEWQDAVLEGQAFLHRLGITGWQDAWVIPGTLEAYRALAADGRLTGRVVGALWWDRHRGLDQIDDLLAQRERALGAAQQAGSGVAGFFPTTVKIMTDGVLENYTGALLEPYCDGCGGHTDNRGLSYVDRELLIEAVTALDGHGFQVHLHAIGDRAVRHGLDAIEAARSVHGDHDRRHHIAHLQIVQPDDLARFAALGVVANCQTYWAQSEPQMDELTIPFLGADRARLQYPFETIRAAGARLAMGSDWSVTTANPLEQLEVAVTRIDPEHRDNAAFLPEQRLSLADAVDAFTAGSAYVNHDDEAGAIRVGARADLAMLDVDVFADGFAAGGRAPLADATVQLTVASGRVVHEI
ncbi:MAG: amidohydrolase [Kineosporiaceae bacterium]|nr:amidohydrolase [Kineosporiaceae bacterium]MBK7623810.1 amidohydrolase [Kineosporiaceae bacterium]MBK8075627.1 amidohydrolase [Kineosporiaceae bacterium]